MQKIPGNNPNQIPISHQEREYIMEVQRRRMIAKQQHIQHLKDLAESKMLSEDAYLKQAMIKSRIHDQTHSPLYHQKYFHEQIDKNYPLPPPNSLPNMVQVSHQRLNMIPSSTCSGNRQMYPPHMIDRNNMHMDSSTLGGMHPQFKNSAGPMKNPKEYSYRY